jgi:hypothetical protein
MKAVKCLEIRRWNEAIYDLAIISIDQDIWKHGLSSIFGLCKVLAGTFNFKI